MTSFVFVLMTCAAVSLITTSVQAASDTEEVSNSFEFERYADLPDSERSQKIDADLRKLFAPGIQLAEVVEGLTQAGAECSWHNRTGETSRYLCKHERKLGGLKAQTTTVYILFNSETCSVTDYKIGTGIRFGFKIGKSRPLGRNPAAHCFKQE